MWWMRIWRCGSRLDLLPHLGFIADYMPDYIPMISPDASTSMVRAREALGRPGISIMLPEMTTRNPAPAERTTSVMWRVQPVGAAICSGWAGGGDWVFAVET